MIKEESFFEREIGWGPEEIKEWSSFIKKKWEVIEAIDNLDFQALRKFFKEDESLAKPEILILIGQKYAQAKKRGEVLPPPDRELVNFLISRLVHEEHLRHEEKITSLAIENLGYLGKEYLPYLKEFLKSENQKIRWGAILGLGKIGKDAFETLEELVHHEDADVRRNAVLALSELGEIAFETLKNLAKDKDWRVRLAVAIGLRNFGEKSFDVLKGLITSNTFEDVLVALTAIESLGFCGKKGINALKILIREKDREVKLSAIRGLGHDGKEAVDTLGDLISSEPLEIQLACVRALGNLGENAKEILKSLTKHENKRIATEAEASLCKATLDKKQILMAIAFREEPFLSNPFFGKEIIERFYKISDVLEEIRKKYPKVIGVSVVGSFAKGYFLPSRDIDFCLIYANEKENNGYKALVDFQNELQKRGIELIHEGWLVDLSNIEQLNLNEFSTQLLSMVFSGVFVGDRERLKSIQRKIIEKINPEKWEEIRKEWMCTTNEYYKTMERFGFSRDDISFVEAARSYLFGLPDLELARKVFK